MGAHAEGTEAQLAEVAKNWFVVDGVYQLIYYASGALELKKRIIKYRRLNCGKEMVAKSGIL